MMVEFIPEQPVIDHDAEPASITAGWDLESGKRDKDAGRLAHWMKVGATGK